MKEQTEIKMEKMKAPKSWKTIESQNFFRFEKVGDSITGLLMSKDKSSRYDIGIYTLKTFENEIKRFHGSTQLDDLLLNVTVPCYIQITLIDFVETPLSPMKVFEVKLGEN